MIRPLISFYRYFGVVIAVLASAAFSGVRVQEPASPLVFLWPVAAGFAIAFLEGDRRALPFHLGLPVPVRSIFLARTLPILFLLWFPVLVHASIWMVWMGTNDPASAFVLSVPASVMTVGVLLLSVTRVDEMTASLGIRVVFNCLVVFAAIAVVFQWYWLVPVCIVCAILLFLQIWRTLPQSFQIAPRWVESDWDESQAPTDSADGELAVVVNHRRRASALRPFLRSVLGHCTFWRGMGLLFCLFASFWTGFGGAWTLLFLAMMMHGGWFRDNTRWLRVLPVRTHTMLLVSVAPFVLMMLAGYMLRWFWGRPPARTQIVDVGAMLGLALATITIQVVGNWRRKGVWQYVSAAALLLVMGGLWPNSSNRGLFLNGASLKLSTFLPDDVWAVALIVAAALVLIYLALHKVFSEAEYLGSPQPLS